MKKQKWPQTLSWLLWCLFIIIAGFTAGYYLTMMIYTIIGRPPEPAAYVLYGLLSLAVLALEFFLFFYILRRAQQGKDHGWLQDSFFKVASHAMSRIAHGDFSVFLDPRDFRDHSELVESINTMAQALGTLETLRQDFVSNVSHEIQSPLTSIGGYAALLENNALMPEQRKHYLEIIKAESARLSKLSSNLLKLSSLDSGVIPLAARQFRLDKQLQSAVILLDPQWSQKNISITADLDKVMVSADEELLSQVWINLLHNAIKFTPEGGRIQITLAAKGGKTICTIADNGMGISPEDQLHIFERFYKVDKSRDRSLGGNGLGLSLVKKIVELHGGIVSVESEPGKGTTLIVTL
ncbi:HAMP domain-containing sensor histidine kinase [Desulfosporosinus sp. OT]|uniref:sensor histidine kinase n=1 Tax=Desulfosporosinus sp. OT TaxID=913865 RepID=UPI000223A8E9|nr:HAMP domain-containing sensor histidine kinase [Desulfosporosinus sp. OT]EGW39773.1 his Kinase A domain protein [Desulfosporosinus sp. OT]